MSRISRSYPYVMPFRHVLVVCDGSSEGYDAVRAASTIASRERATLTVAAVAELEQPGRGCQVGTGAWNQVLMEAADADLERARTIVESPAFFTVLKGPMARALLDAERNLGCDLIVMPRRRRGLSRLVTRDRTKALRRRADCQVLSLP